MLLTGCSSGKIFSTDRQNSLDIHYRNGPLDACVGSELDKPSRIDTESSQTYFWVKLSYDLDHPNHKGIFLESYQSSNMILSSKITYQQPYVWDGIWLRPGFFCKFKDWFIEGGPVYYTFSTTKKPSSVGCLIAIGREF